MQVRVIVGASAILLPIILLLSTWFIFAYFSWTPRHQLIKEDVWPTELRDLLDSVANSGEIPENVEVHSHSFFSYYWRISPGRSVLAEHVARFELHPVSCDSDEVQTLLEMGPESWTLQMVSEMKCYANEEAATGAEDGEFEYVLIHDVARDEIFVYQYFNF